MSWQYLNWNSDYNDFIDSIENPSGIKKATSVAFSSKKKLLI